MGSRLHTNDAKLQKHVLVNRNCIAVVLHKIKNDVQEKGGHAIFADFLQQNSMCFWNACLTRSIASLEYRGCLVPTTLLISGTNFALEVIRSAWARRVLRPPKGYTINKLGDVGMVDMLPVLQTQFAPLSEALCKVVADLNSDQVLATTESIRSRLEESFPEMQVPCGDILHKTLGGLIRERKVYHTGNGYFIVSPDTYRQRAVSPVGERQMLMTNEEAIVKLHSKNKRECSLAIQVDEMDIAAAWKCATSSFLQARHAKATSNQSIQMPSSSDLQLLEQNHSMKVLRLKGNSKNNVDGGVDRSGSFKESKKINLNEFEGDMNDIHKSEKQSMLAKLLKRMQFLTDKSSKHMVFSAQFPPLEWMGGESTLCHSVATQTQMFMQKVNVKPAFKHPESSGLRIPWEDSKNNYEYKKPTYWTSPDMNLRKLYGDVNGSSPRKNLSLPTRQNQPKYSPSHRYSHHGAFINHPKRRHRHRRSSSESPKVQKTLLNGYCSPSTSSKSRADHSDDKICKSSSSASPLTVHVKATLPAHKPLAKKYELVNCHSKDDNVTGRDTSSNQSQSNSLDREVLKDVKNISTSHVKTPIVKKGNIPVHSEIAQLCNSNKNSTEKANILNMKSVTPSVDPVKNNDAICHDKSVSSQDTGSLQTESLIQPLVLKSFVDIPKPKTPKNSPKEIIIDNSVSVEVAVEKSPSPKSKPKNVSTTIVTEETTVTKANGNSKVVTVTSITTSLSHGDVKNADKVNPDSSTLESDTSSEKEKSSSSVNDLNIETEKGARIIDCSSSCNIVTEVK